VKEQLNRNGAVRVEGATLRYTVEGVGLPVLVIGSAIYYPRTFSHQLRETCRLTCVDLRHFAENEASFSPAGVTLDTYMADIEQVRVALGLERAVLIGHSHHGNLALEYAKAIRRGCPTWSSLALRHVM
jgi:proline iminopeptidase